MYLKIIDFLQHDLHGAYWKFGIMSGTPFKGINIKR